MARACGNAQHEPHPAIATAATQLPFYRQYQHRPLDQRWIIRLVRAVGGVNLTRDLMNMLA